MTPRRKNLESLSNTRNPPKSIISSDQTEDAQIEFPSGAKRNDATRGYAFHLLCPTALRYYAATAKEGELVYGPRNWEKGIPTENYIDHAMEHLVGAMDKGRPAPARLKELAHTLWNVAAAIHNETGCQHHDWDE